MTERIREIIKGDRLFQLYGMELLDAREGYARVRAEVREEFLNAHDIAHGGFIFALLDVAFAISVNTTNDAVGVQFNMNIFRSTKKGDRVVAESKVIHGGRSSMVVQVRAESENTGKLLAQGMATALPLPNRKEENQ